MNNLGWFGDGIYPHHNVLGIAAEMGIPAASLYVVFIIAVIWYIGRRISKCNRTKQNTIGLVLMAVLGVFVYQQARGMLHDTWTLKELYFWVGFGCGVISLAVNYSGLNATWWRKSMASDANGRYVRPAAAVL
jgi:O-antigen ligase